MKTKMKFVLLRLTMLVFFVVVAGCAAPLPGDDLAGECVDFESLALGTRYHIGDTFVDAGATVSMADFEWTGGTVTSNGFAEIENGGSAGGSGQDLEVNNILLQFDFGGSIQGLTLQFGEYGGNLNIEINGAFMNFGNFSELNGMTIGGASISVSNGSGNDLGTLKLSGTIDSFAIGGQELWIDDICPIP